MGKNKNKGKTHIQAWLNPNNEDDRVAIEAIEYFRNKGFSTKQALRLGLSAILDYEKNEGMDFKPESSEMEMLRSLASQVRSMMSVVSKLKGGYTITDEDEATIRSATSLDEDTLNLMVSQPIERSELDKDEDDEW